MADAVSFFLGRPFAEQVSAFRLRLGDLRPTSAWTDLAGQDHDRAFMVAGAVKADLLADLAAAVDKAITKGTTLEEFRRDFREIVTRHGWHGWTGEGTKGGEAWRTRVIYRTNLATSYAAGRHAQLIRGNYAFWVYRHGGSREPRLDHLSWDGVALPPDHPFWATHYPPNGWGCSCRVFGTRTRAGIRRLGGDPDKTLPPGWDRISPKTGVQVGIDKGWNHAPGRTVAASINAVIAAKVEQWPPRIAGDILRASISSDAFGKWMASPVDDWVVASLPKQDAGMIGAEVRAVHLSAETMAKQGRNHPELTAFDYAEIPRIILERTRLLQDSETSLIYTFEPAGHGGHVLVIKATRSGKRVYVTSFRRISADDKARRAELARLIARAEKWGRT